MLEIIISSDKRYATLHMKDRSFTLYDSEGDVLVLLGEFLHKGESCYDPYQKNTIFRPKFQDETVIISLRDLELGDSSLPVSEGNEDVS